MNQRIELRQMLRQQASKNGKKLAKSSEQTLVRVQIALTLLPLLTACVYLFGMSLHMGYVDFFHVDSSEFPLSTEQYLLTGAAALVVNLLPVITFPIVLFPALLFLCIFSAIAFKSTIWAMDALLEKARQFVDRAPLLKKVRATVNGSIKNNQPNWFTALLTTVIAWYVRLAYLMVTFTIVSMIAYYSYGNGETLAIRQVQEIKEGTFTSANTLRLAKHSDQIVALRIVCNTIQCAFWTEKNGTFFLRHSQIDSVTISPKPNDREVTAGEKVSCSQLGKLDKAPSGPWAEWAIKPAISNSPSCVYIIQNQT